MKLIDLTIACVALLGLSACSTVGNSPELEPHMPKISWPNGAKAAIALTYDDGVNSQLDTAVPTLNEANLKGTFYIVVGRDGWNSRVRDWEVVSQQGHELGNKSIYHPCRATGAGKGWISRDSDLDRYSAEQMAIELDKANRILSSVDNETTRTFAYPCGESQTSDGSYYSLIKPLFIGARAVHDVPYEENDRYNVTTFAAHNSSFEEIVSYIDGVIEKGEAGSLSFFGVGGDYLSVSADMHQKVVDYLKSRNDDVWVDTMVNIADHMEAAGW
ncbi:polysaccharide deacetylase family protein [Hirschia maritima]|uniref:polysaccharide deacetylase family protein n=1 Tax=Hirschia maritima TaxID=1121961 RepID=UPI0003A0ED49|nr:polysaccharide deacetylase family protein [Hirschia maritima]